MAISKEEAFKELVRRGDIDPENFTPAQRAAYDELVKRGEFDAPMTAKGTIMSGFGGFNRGLANLTDTVYSSSSFNPDNPIYDPLNKKKWEDTLFNSQPTKVGNWLRDISRKPENRLERVADSAGRMVADSIPYAALPLGGAGSQMLKGAEKTGTNAFQQGTGHMLKQIAGTPGRAAIGELASASGAGAGEQLAQEAFPDSKVAPFVGALAGGMAPVALGYAPASMLARAGNKARNYFSASNQERLAREEVSDLLSISGDDAANIRSAQQLERDIPGVQYSLAEATQKPSLARTQQAFESRVSGKELDARVARRKSNIDAINAYKESVAPGDYEAPSYIVDRANLAVKDLTGNISSKVDDITAKRQAVTDYALPPADKVGIGQSLRSQRDTLYKEAQAAMSDRKTELGLDGLQDQLPYADIRATLKASTDENFWKGGKDVPDVVKRLDDWENPTISKSDLIDLRQAISSEMIESTTGLSPNFQKKRNLAILEKEIDAVINKNFNSAEAQAWAQFRNEYKTNVVQRFRDNVAAKVSAKGQSGFYRTPDEDVADAFWKGGESGIRQFKAIYGDDAEAGVNLASAVLDDFRTSAVVDGLVDPNKAALWVRKNEKVLKEFPAIDNLVSDVRTVDGALAARQKQLVTRQKAVEKNALVRRIDSVSNGVAKPEDLINEAINDHRKMLVLRNRLRGDQDALNGLKRQVWQKVTNGSPDEIQKYLNDNRKSLELVFSNKHLADIDRIQRAAKLAETIPMPSGREIELDPIKRLSNVSGLNLPSAASRFYAFKSGRLNKAYLVTEQVGRMGRQYLSRHSTALLEEALYDPQVAADLSGLFWGKGLSKDSAKRLNTYLFAIGEGDDDAN